MKIYHNKISIFLIFASTFLCNILNFSVQAAKKSKTATVVKEYVVVSAEKNSILERLNLLFDKLKLFANYPKNLKELQEKTNTLEDSLRKKLSEIKDSSYIISSVHDEVWNARNDIPIQETNEKAKKIFDKIVEFWNSANGEVEKINKAGQEFETIISEIKAKIDEIGKVLEEGNSEINNIKEELEKIAKIEEEIAGKNERDISEQISLLIDKKGEETKQPSVENQAYQKAEVSNNLDSQNAQPKVDSKNDFTKTLTLTQSLEVVWRIFINFVGVAWNGAKDLFVRLFVVQTTSAEPEKPVTTEPEAKPLQLSIKKPVDPKNENKPEVPQAQNLTPTQEEAQYKDGMINSMYQLKNAIFGFASNGFLYLKKIYSNMRSEKQSAVVDQLPKNDDYTKTPAEENEKPDLPKEPVEQKANEPKNAELKAEPQTTPVMAEPKLDPKKEKPKGFKLKLGK